MTVQRSYVGNPDEVRIAAIYNVEEEYWDINFPDEENVILDERRLSEITPTLYQIYLGW